MRVWRWLGVAPRGGYNPGSLCAVTISKKVASDQQNSQIIAGTPARRQVAGRFNIEQLRGRRHLGEIMAITLKTPEDLQGMRVAGKLAAEVLAMLKDHVKPGVTTEELDRLAYDHIVNVQQAIPANVGYHGFPKTLCSSVN